MKVALMTMMLVIAGPVIPARDSQESLVGTWRLISQESRETRGSVTFPFGQTPLGSPMYARGGTVSVHLMRADLPRFASGDRMRGSDAEVRAVVEGSASYYGTYTVNPSTHCVTHHIIGSSFPNWNGTDQVRCYRIEGRKLTLTSAPFTLGGQMVTSVLIWERVN